MSVTFIEVGGYKGSHTARALKDNPDWKGVILEPNPKYFWFLQGKFEHDDRVTILNRAMANMSGPRMFYLGGNPASSSLLAEKTNVNEAQAIEVICVQASIFLSGYKGETVVNMNCEGGELEIMEDLLDTGAYKGKKFFYSTHKNCVLQEDRYDKIVARMKEVGLEYLGGTYGTLHKKALENKISIPEQLKVWHKEEWGSWFKGGPNE